LAGKGYTLEIAQNSDAESVAKNLRNADQPNNQNNAIYEQLAAEAPTMSMSITDHLRNKIGGGLPTGSMINIGGRLMKVVKEVYWDEAGRNDQRIDIMDVATGVTKSFNGMRNDSSSVETIDGWAAGLAAL